MWTQSWFGWSKSAVACDFGLNLSWSHAHQLQTFYLTKCIAITTPTCLEHGESIGWCYQKVALHHSLDFLALYLKTTQ